MKKHEVGTIKTVASKSWNLKPRDGQKEMVKSQFVTSQKFEAKN